MTTKGVAELYLRETMASLKRIEEGVTLHEIMQDSSMAGPMLQQTLYTICRYYEPMRWILTCDGEKVRHRNVRLCLWVLTQCFFMTSLQQEKAVSIAIGVARKLWHKKEADYLNFLLRKKSELSWEEWQIRIKNEAPIWVRYGLPEVIWNEWKKQFTEEQIAEFSHWTMSPAKTILRIRKGYELSNDLHEHLIPISSPNWASHVKLWQIEKNETFFGHAQLKTKAIYCQDPTTLAAPTLLKPHAGERIADLCCAPGGKTLLLAEMMDGQGELWCCDRSEKRLKIAETNLSDYASWCRFKVQDATKPDLPKEYFDGILLDVPCSNSGVLRRHPDVRLHYSEEKTKELCLLQQNILEQTVSLLKANGRMVYSTCSINEVENRQQIEYFLQKHPEFVLEKEYLILPGELHDGGYAALLIKCS